MVTESDIMLSLVKTLAKAHKRIEQNQYISTDRLMDKALYMETPWGKAVIESVDYAYTRRITINNKQHTIKYYRITFNGIAIKSILTAESTIWRITG
jgi:hypothetical protein